MTTASQTTTGWRSCLYEGSVWHHRLQPREHQFEHPLFLCWLDLDELDELHARSRWFSRNRFNLYSFYDADHRRPGPGGVKAGLVAWLAGQGVALPADARISLVTFPRVLGYVFNPVSFYFCQRADGTPLCAVAEVGNTFGEQKLYLVPVAAAGDGRFHLRVPKFFYVSPFSTLDTEFEFNLSVPGEQLEARVDDWAAGDRILRSALRGRRVAWSDARLAWFAVKYPLLTLKVITLIHWHALRLWWRKVPFYRKADQPERQLDVLNPHASLSGKTP